VSTAGPVTRWWAVTDSAYRERFVEPGQDLGASAAGEGVVGEVGLPALVGLPEGSRRDSAAITADSGTTLLY
jgi:hypothetical protein